MLGIVYLVRGFLLCIDQIIIHTYFVLTRWLRFCHSQRRFDVWKYLKSVADFDDTGIIKLVFSLFYLLGNEQCGVVSGEKKILNRAHNSHFLKNHQEETQNTCDSMTFQALPLLNHRTLTINSNTPNKERRIRFL